MNVQFGWEAPASFPLFRKWITGKPLREGEEDKSFRTKCWFPYVDEEKLEEGYDNYKSRLKKGMKVPKKQKTLRRSYKIWNAGDRWVLDMVKLGQLEKKKKGTYNVFKSLLLKKYEKLPSGWYNIKLNGAGHSPKHIARFQITEDDINSRKKIIYKFNLLLPELPSYRPVNGSVVRRETSVRDVFEKDIFDLLEKVFA